MPEVQDIKHTGPVLKHKQRKTEILSRLISRICVAGPSGVGKGVLFSSCETITASGTEMRQEARQ